MSGGPEHALQRAVVDYLSAAIAPAGSCPPGAETMWHALDHGQQLARGGEQWVKMRARGVIAGIPDLLIWHRGTTIAVELKSATGQASPAQKAYAASLKAAGGHWQVVRTLDEMAALLAKHDVPVRCQLLPVSAPQQRRRAA